MRALLTILHALLLAGCASPGDDEAADADEPVTGVADVHGLGLDPSRDDIVYVATHHGLVRGENGTWTRVGDSRDDLMGFTMHPRDGSIMWSSGHYRTGGNIGVQISRDGGRTWEQIALPGVDFHTMTVSPADPDRLWGYYRGELKRSDDGGDSWRLASMPPDHIYALAAHPEDPDRLYASTRGAILVSADGGGSWSRLAEFGAASLAVDPQEPATLYAGTQEGVLRSTDGGADWMRLAPVAENAIPVVLVADARQPDVLYAGTSPAGVYRSTDGGQTWERVLGPA